MFFGHFRKGHNFYGFMFASQDKSRVLLLQEKDLLPLEQISPLSWRKKAKTKLTKLFPLKLYINTYHTTVKILKIGTP